MVSMIDNIHGRLHPSSSIFAQLNLIIGFGVSEGGDRSESVSSRSPTVSVLSDTMSKESATSSFSSEDESSDPILSENIRYVKTILRQLVDISLTVRKSYNKYRFEDVDAACDESAFEPFRKCLATHILRNFEDLEARKLNTTKKVQQASDCSRLTPVQKRLISVNTLRRNRMLHVAVASRLAEVESKVGSVNAHVHGHSKADTWSNDGKIEKNSTIDRKYLQGMKEIALFNSAADRKAESEIKPDVTRLISSEATRPTRSTALQDYPRSPDPGHDGSIICPYCRECIACEVRQDNVEHAWK